MSLNMNFSKYRNKKYINLIYIKIIESWILRIDNFIYKISFINVLINF